MHLNHLHNASYHVEPAGQDPAAAEVGEAEEVYQEEQQQYVGEDQEQALEQDITNFVDTQGKHRFMYPSILPKFKFMQAPVHLKTQCHYNKFKSYNYYYVYALSYRRCLIPSCMSRTCFIQ